MKKKCSSCKYWEGKISIKVPNKFGVEITEFVKGQCHRYPHRIFKDHSDWCGEHDLRSPSPEELRMVTKDYDGYEGNENVD
jgi:hypothetical protein